MPTRREFPAESAEHIPHWLSQRKNGDAPSQRSIRPRALPRPGVDLRLRELGLMRVSCSHPISRGN
eukprot:1976078-Pyramimonas_sp.AAC.1